MSSPINAVSQLQPVQSVAQAPVAATKTPEAQASKAPADTVNISSAAKAILQEVQETHVQTVKEAKSGDAQAKRLLAREAAAQAATKG